MLLVKQALLVGALFVATAAVPVFASEVPALSEFSATDTQMLFEQDAKPMQLAALSHTEMKETEGRGCSLVLEEL